MRRKRGTGSRARSSATGSATAFERALMHRGEFGDALPYLEEALGLWRELGDAGGEGLALEAIGWAHDGRGDYPAARVAHEESLAVREAAGIPEIEGASSRAGLCHVLVATGDVERAEEMAEKLLAIASTSEASLMQQLALHFLADCPLVAGSYREAQRRYLRALAYAREARLPGRVTDELLGVAMALAGQGELAEAVRLASAAHAEQEVLAKETDHWWRGMQERLIGGARARLAPDAVEAAERKGRDVPFDSVVDEVLAMESP
jgi:tetratricopeptide (TPR) repeat protein